MLHFM